MANFFGLYPGSGSTSGGSGVTSLNTQTGALTLVAGTNVTITAGAGTLTIASTGGGGGTPAGPNGALQYNNSGSFGGSGTALFDSVTSYIQVNGLEDSLTKLSVDPINRVLMNTTGLVPVVDWQVGNLYDDTNIQSVVWFGSGAGRSLVDSAGISSLGWDARLLADISGLQSVDWRQRFLIDASGGVVSVQWDNRICLDSSGLNSVDWGNRQLDDNTETPSVDYQNRSLLDTGTISAANWNNRQLFDSTGVISANWSRRTLNDATGNIVLTWFSNVGGNHGTVFNQPIYDTVASHKLSISPSARALYDNSGVGNLSLDWVNRALWNASATKVFTWSGSTLSSLVALDMGANKIQNLLDPTAAQDAATKNYVDLSVLALQPKAAVQAATTAAITLSGAQTIDGYSAVAGDRILVKNQASGIDNGIYVVASGAWSRSADMAVGSTALGSYVPVLNGTTNGSKAFIEGATPSVVGTNALTFSLFNSNIYSASGLGIVLSGGNVFSLQIDGTTLSQSASGVKVAAGGITSTELNTTGVSAGSYTNTNLTVDANGRITAASNGSAGGVTSLNSLTGALSIAAGSGITVTPSGSTITIASTGGGGAVTSVSNVDGTLTASPTTGAVVIGTATNGIGYNQLAVEAELSIISAFRFLSGN